MNASTRIPILALAVAGAGLLPTRDATAQQRAAVAAPQRPSETVARAARRTQPPQGAPNVRMLPDISLVGDLIADLSPDGSTQEGETRLGVREIEVAVQAAVDPSFRGDVFLGFSDAEGVGIEQAYLTATSLPWQLEMRLGRFLAPFGKQNTTHRHDLHTVDHSLVVQRLLGEEGLKGTGVYLSRIFAPLGFFQELIVTATERLGEAPEDLVTEEPMSRDLDGLAYAARLRNYWDLSSASNVEISGSMLTGKKERPAVPVGDANAVPMRQTTFGVDATFRWRPPRQGLYRSFILQAELLAQQNSNDNTSVIYPGKPSTLDDVMGFYVFGRYQVSRRGYLGARYDSVEDPEFGGERTSAVSGYWQFYPSEFSKIVGKFERVSPVGQPAFNRMILQATFALGPHKPHPF